MKGRCSIRLQGRCSPGPLAPRHGSAGFTLIEVLIALAIASVVLTALYSVFFLSHRAVTAVDDSLVRIQEARSMVDILKREVEAALFEKEKKYTAFKIEDREFFGKQASRLTFTAFSTLKPGLVRFQYRVEEKDGSLLLHKVVDSAYVTAEGSPIEIMETIDSFTVEAWYNNNWVRTWDSGLSGGIPEEVRISVKLRRETGKPLIEVSDIARPVIGRRLL